MADLPAEPEPTNADLVASVEAFAARHGIDVEEARVRMLRGIVNLDKRIMAGLSREEKKALDALPAKWSDDEYVRDYMRNGAAACARKYGLNGPKAATKMAERAGARRTKRLKSNPDAYRGILTLTLEDVLRDLVEHGRPGDPKVAESMRRILSQIAELNGLNEKGPAEESKAPTIIRVDMRIPGTPGYEDGEIIEIPAETPDNAEFTIVDGKDDDEED